MIAGKDVAKGAGKKRGLGRGLEALLGPKAAAEALPLQALPGDQLRSLPVDAMVPDKYQPRRSTSTSAPTARAAARTRSSPANAAGAPRSAPA